MTTINNKNQRLAAIVIGVVFSTDVIKKAELYTKRAVIAQSAHYTTIVAHKKNGTDRVVQEICDLTQTLINTAIIMSIILNLW